LKGDENILNISNYKFGDRHIEVLSKGIQLLPNINQFNLSHNRISDRGAEKILSKISRNVKDLNLSNNMIGYRGCQYL